MGVSAPTVRVHIHRARARLRDLLGTEEMSELMTERWQRELKKLGGVDAPVSRMRAQIANGPSSDPSQPEPGRSPRQRITAGVVAFAVFAAAGVFAYRALKPAARSLPAATWGDPSSSTCADRLRHHQPPIFSCRLLW